MAYYEFVVERRAEQAAKEQAAPRRKEGRPPVTAAAPPRDAREEPDEDTDDLLHIALGIGLPAALLGLGGGWFLTRRALAPVAALTRGAGRIHERNLAEPLPRSGNGDELVRDAVEDARVLAEPFAVQVTLSVCDPLTVCGDRHRLRQLLLNLTDNAVKYNQPSGHVDLALKANGAAAQLTIANTGPGIPSDVLPRVFDRFFRGDPSHGHDVEGCGLGLSIAQWIARTHGGDIHLTSEMGKLTIATVQLPAMPWAATRDPSAGTSQPGAPQEMTTASPVARKPPD